MLDMEEQATAQVLSQQDIHLGAKVITYATQKSHVLVQYTVHLDWHDQAVLAPPIIVIYATEAGVEVICLLIMSDLPSLAVC